MREMVLASPRPATGCCDHADLVGRAALGTVDPWGRAVAPTPLLPGAPPSDSDARLPSTIGYSRGVPVGTQYDLRSRPRFQTAILFLWNLGFPSRRESSFRNVS